MSRRQLAIPLSTDDEWAFLTLPLPLSEDQWQHLMIMLDSMKPGLVDSHPAPEGRATDAPE